MAKTVVFPARLQNAFKKAAKAAFPREEYALLLGKCDENGEFKVEDLYFPSDRAENSGPYHVDVRDEWFKHAQERYFKQGLIVLGDIHSHCYDSGKETPADMMPSEVDIHSLSYLKDGLEPYYSIMGILRLIKKKKSITSKLALYPPIIPYEVSTV